MSLFMIITISHHVAYQHVFSHALNYFLYVFEHRIYNYATASFLISWIFGK